KTSPHPTLPHHNTPYRNLYPRMSQVTASSSSYRWEKEETEDLINWIEENLDTIKGKQVLGF
ncbi:hypothetical protein BGX38DRAFT_1229745, partial [Terfezia claveryi]